MVSTLSAPTGERTGIVHTTSRLVDPALLAFSHFLNVANPEFSQTQTGQDIKAQTDVQPDFVEYVPVESLNITGSELPAGNILFVFFDDVAGRSVTSYRVSISSKRLFPETPYQEG